MNIFFLTVKKNPKITPAQNRRKNSNNKSFKAILINMFLYYNIQKNIAI